MKIVADNLTIALPAVFVLLGATWAARDLRKKTGDSWRSRVRLAIPAAESSALESLGQLFGEAEKQGLLGFDPKAQRVVAPRVLMPFVKDFKRMARRPLLLRRMLSTILFCSSAVTYSLALASVAAVLWCVAAVVRNLKSVGDISFVSVGAPTLSALVFGVGILVLGDRLSSLIDRVGVDE